MLQNLYLLPAIPPEPAALRATPIIHPNPGSADTPGESLIFPIMKNILMLDKDPDEAFIVKAAFADLHIAIQLDWFIDFEQLYSHLSSSELPPDLLLLELQSPFNYGSIYLQLIKQLPKYCNLPVVMYGDLQRAADTQPSFALGATAYLPKNVPYDTLKINLQQLINWDLAEAMNWPQEDRILQG